jgi:hypothetical protein
MIVRITPFLLAAAAAACGNGPEETSSRPSPAAATVAAPAQPVFPRKSLPEGARVYFVAPTDGETVRSPFRVVFGLSGAGVAPAGIERDDAGHHHLLINTDPPSLEAPIPADAQHVHFGLGQTETELTLPVGSHRLQLLLGDHLHVPHNPPLLSAPITIEVVE